MPERKITYDRFQEQDRNGILVKAPSWERLYIDAALALTDVIGRLDAVDVVDKERLTASGKNTAELMLNWLNEILKLFREKKFLARRIVFEKFDGKTITATLSGESHKPLRHGVPPEIHVLESAHLSFGDGTNPEPHFFVKAVLSK